MAEAMAARLRSLSRYLNGEIAIGLAVIGLVAFLILFKDLVQGHDPMQGDLFQRLKPPGTPGHWLGTDANGRDIWSRLVEGLPWSTAAAGLATLISLAIGTVLGVLAAEREGWPRTVVRQAVDTVLSFPGLVVAIVIIAVVGQGFWTLTLGRLTWRLFTRVVFAEAQSLMKRDYVLAARLLGAGRWAVLSGHVLPGLRPTLLVVGAFQFANLLIAESALSFLGVGAPLGVPTWGNMMAEARNYTFTAPHMLFAPATAIVILVVAANLIGDGIGVAARQQGRSADQ